MDEGGRGDIQRKGNDRWYLPGVCIRSHRAGKSGRHRKRAATHQSASGHDSDSVENLQYTVSFKGTSKYKLVNRTSFFPCDPNVRFENFKNHTSAFSFTVENSTIFVFSGGKDRQPNLENYFLSVDTANLAMRQEKARKAKSKASVICA
jgi:hypothetical protein